MERDKLDRALTDLLRRDNALLRDVSEHYVKERQYAPQIEYSREPERYNPWDERDRGLAERRRRPRFPRANSRKRSTNDMGYLSDVADLSDPAELSDF
jgi:hypothetical protein